MHLYLAFAATDRSEFVAIDSVEDACNSFYATMYGISDEHVSLAAYETKTLKYPIWFTKEILDFFKLKSKHWCLNRKTKYNIHYEKVKELRGIIRKEITEALLRLLKSISKTPRNSGTS